MALEPITRQEKIISGQDLTPITRMEKFLKQYGGGGGGSVPAAGGVTTLHINVTAVNMETMEATFTADKTPLEMQQASAIGPTWCVVSFAAGVMGEEVISLGVPPAFYSIEPAFGQRVWPTHEDGNNIVAFAVSMGTSDTWNIDLQSFMN